MGTINKGEGDKKGGCKKMDKRKYLSKTLIAQYEYYGKFDDDGYIELIYRLKDNSLIVQFSGDKYSIYSIQVGFGKSIGRKGIYGISEKEFNIWKAVRKESENSELIDWEEMKQEQYFSDYEDSLKCSGNDKMPF